jgi:hypothetical protein
VGQAAGRPCARVGTGCAGRAGMKLARGPMPGPRPMCHSVGPGPAQYQPGQGGPVPGPGQEARMDIYIKNCLGSD